MFAMASEVRTLNRSEQCAANRSLSKVMWCETCVDEAGNDFVFASDDSTFEFIGTREADSWTAIASIRIIICIHSSKSREIMTAMGSNQNESHILLFEIIWRLILHEAKSRYSSEAAILQFMWMSGQNFSCGSPPKSYQRNRNKIILRSNILFVYVFRFGFNRRRNFVSDFSDFLVDWTAVSGLKLSRSRKIIIKWLLPWITRTIWL